MTDRKSTELFFKEIVWYYGPVFVAIAAVLVLVVMPTRDGADGSLSHDEAVDLLAVRLHASQQ